MPWRCSRSGLKETALVWGSEACPFDAFCDEFSVIIAPVTLPLLKNILESVPAFIVAVHDETREAGLDLSNFEIDHFCFRVESLSQYDHYKKEMKVFGNLLSEAKINGRPIATFKLNQPIKFLDKEVSCLEIPSPKEGAPYPLGLEHLECVVEEPLSVFIQRYPLLSFDTRAIKKPINAEIALKLPSGKSVKFHNQSLESVIAIENKLLSL